MDRCEGEYVLDLGLKDFRIFDNDVQQEIESVELGGAPISAAIGQAFAISFGILQ